MYSHRAQTNRHVFPSAHPVSRSRRQVAPAHLSSIIIQLTAAPAKQELTNPLLQQFHLQQTPSRRDEGLVRRLVNLPAMPCQLLQAHRVESQTYTHKKKLNLGVSERVRRSICMKCDMESPAAKYQSGNKASGGNCGG